MLRRLLPSGARGVVCRQRRMQSAVAAAASLPDVLAAPSILDTQQRYDRADFLAVARAAATERAVALCEAEPIGASAEVMVEEAERPGKLDSLEAHAEYQRLMQSRSAASGDADETSAPRWFDDEAEAREKLRQHHRSPEYLELHRGTIGATQLGLYGGEAGFETSPRTHVDPDNPHIPFIYSLADYARNRRLSRYGFYRLHLGTVDIDKMCRHARMVPTPGKLFTDTQTGKVSLNDANASAIIRHGWREMLGVENAEGLGTMYAECEETFERMLAASMPAVEVGPMTHAAMIRVCARAGRFEEGYEWFWTRAVDEARAAQEFRESMASDERWAPGTSRWRAKFDLTADLFDAVLDLCVSTKNYARGLEEFRRAVGSGRRLRKSTLDNALLACAHLRHSAAAQDVWQLYEFYRRKPDDVTYEYLAAAAARAAVTGATEGIAALLPTVVDDAVAALSNARMIKPLEGQASEHAVRASPHTFAWAFHGLALSAAFGQRRGSSILSQLGSLEGRGDVADHVVLTMALQYCALHPEDGAETAIQIWQRHVVRPDVNAVMEMVVLLARAVAFGDKPVTAADLQLVTDAVEVFRTRVGQRQDGQVRFGSDEAGYITKRDLVEAMRTERGDTDPRLNSPHDAAMRRARRSRLALDTSILVACARVGAVAQATSVLGRVTLEAHPEALALADAEGDDLARPASHLFVLALQANCRASAGGAHITQEIVERFFSIPGGGELCLDFIANLCECRRAHGKPAEGSALHAALLRYGIPEADVCLLELMDAYDVRRIEAPAAEGSSTSLPQPELQKLEGLLGLATTPAARETVKRVALPVLDELRVSSETEAFEAATTAFTLDPFTLRRLASKLYVGARDMGLRKQGQYRPAPRLPRTNIQERARRFNPNTNDNTAVDLVV